MNPALLSIVVSVITSLVYLLLSSITAYSMEPWLGVIAITVALLSITGSVLFQLVQLNKDTKKVNTLFRFGRRRTMELKVRGVEPYAVQKIDELAKNSGLSRNAYLKQLIESAAILDELREQENRYIKVAEMLAGIIKENTVAMEKIAQLYGYDRKGG